MTDSLVVKQNYPPFALAIGVGLTRTHPVARGKGDKKSVISSSLLNALTRIMLLQEIPKESGSFVLLRTRLLLPTERSPLCQESGTVNEIQASAVFSRDSLHLGFR